MQGGPSFRFPEGMRRRMCHRPLTPLPQEGSIRVRRQGEAWTTKTDFMAAKSGPLYILGQDTPPHPHPRLQPPAQLVLHVRVLWHVCRGPESGFWEPVVGRVREAFPLVCVNTQCSVSNTHQCQEESWFLGSFLATSTHICAIIIAASAKPAGVDW